MRMNETLKKLRIAHNLTQEGMAKKLVITRQAVSRWENGETEPNVETLKLISKTFNISINTLLDSPRALICQVCGMPLEEDEYISKDKDGHFNEEFCKWCFVKGTHQYNEDNFEELIDECVKNMLQINPAYQERQVRMMLEENLPKLKYTLWTTWWTLYLNSVTSVSHFSLGFSA
ncbi:helix-turn-helix domain-containing protein [Tetragenococcus koreensis]|uniref:HTH cro/C1-type domain-containing protein n=1 Tax=Tetragenococcus koreensis TaxID=290335 RepID=A0AAN4RJQ8_9ENTE|nr:zinc ribbon domain-containing protein [Tetragenococcus koreensis]MDN6730428.1 helix-turn-helix domain-containing protein [Alkalibacterium sp.]AYW45119.1 transcriptional regulator [Tetragenococcus koreensis]MCF1584455.1 helix-turn-helix domain-containing protein [Tetragenococcus koreensis]MCF1614004.1 helix-turn-helix domain-containing protein [Tetragenococcus koreensis]MCF1618342.1 helix-turn-helix domain-containing protein [Tetragenococcus koreensis]